MSLPLQTGPDNPILRQKSKPIAKIDKSLLKLAKNMAATLEKEKGLGLAAPQVGHNLRLIFVRLNYKTPHELVLPMINPKITEISKETALAEEGCLSLPKQFAPVTRAKALTVQFQTLKNEPQTLKLEDLNARIIQHEIDHLDGVLFIDRAEKDQTTDKDLETVPI